MREIKFRAWDKVNKEWASCILGQLDDEPMAMISKKRGGEWKNWQQFTGLKDKNEVQEVYEGDIIDEYGNIKGNIYEMDKGETDLVIEGFGTAAWSKTEKAGLERGLKYPE